MNFEENESKEQGIQDFLSIITLIRTMVKTKVYGRDLSGVLY